MKKDRLITVLICLAFLTAGMTSLRALAGLEVDDVTFQTTPTEELEQMANDYFEQGQFKQALPLLKAVAVRYRNQPEKAAPWIEKVRVAEEKLGTISPPPEGINGVPRTPHVLPKQGEVYDVTLKRLGNFDYDAENGGNIPDDVLKLSGATVKIRGFMIPLDQADRITRFVLVPDLFACCFGQPPSLQHTIVVQTPQGKSVKYYPDEIDCTGILTVEEKREDGFIVSVFTLNVTSVKPAPR
jgi:hypothetical protein